LIDLETKPTRKQSQKKKFERLLKDCLLAVANMVKATHIKRQRKRCCYSKAKTVFVWLVLILNQNILKSQKNHFQFYASFWVVYSLRDMGIFAAYKESQKKSPKENRKTCFLSFRYMHYLKSHYEMKARFFKRLQRIGHCCKNATKGKMRFLYRRKILIGKLDKTKMNFPKLWNAWGVGGIFDLGKT